MCLNNFQVGEDFKICPTEDEKKFLYHVTSHVAPSDTPTSYYSSWYDLTRQLEQRTFEQHRQNANNWTIQGFSFIATQLRINKFEVKKWHLSLGLSRAWLWLSLVRLVSSRFWWPRWRSRMAFWAARTGVGRWPPEMRGILADCNRSRTRCSRWTCHWRRGDCRAAPGGHCRRPSRSRCWLLQGSGC